MQRREFLKAGVGVSTSVLAASVAPTARAVAASVTGETRWRAFEVTTRAEIAAPGRPARAWLPLPLSPDTNYHKGLGQSWTGNADGARIVRDPRYGAAIFCSTRFFAHNRRQFSAH